MHMKSYEVSKPNQDQKERAEVPYEAPTIRTIEKEEIVKALGPAHATTPGGSTFP